MIYGLTEIINERKGRRRTFQYNGGWVTKEKGDSKLIEQRRFGPHRLKEREREGRERRRERARERVGESVQPTDAPSDTDAWYQNRKHANVGEKGTRLFSHSYFLTWIFL